jgi:hypothetical protein
MSAESRHGPVHASWPVLDSATSLVPLPHPVFTVSIANEVRLRRSIAESPTFTIPVPLEAKAGSPKKSTDAPSGETTGFDWSWQNGRPTSTGVPPWTGTLKKPLPRQLTMVAKPWL